MSAELRKARRSGNVRKVRELRDKIHSAAIGNAPEEPPAIEEPEPVEEPTDETPVASTEGETVEEPTA